MFVPRRLDKFLRDATAWSVVDIRRACAAGRVVHRAPSDARGGLVLPDRLVFEEDNVFVDGAIVRPKEQHHYVVLNKPPFVTSTASDPDGRTDLRPWLREMPLGTFPVGRLDRETSGALLFTDDGDFANAMLQPDHHTEKLYWLWLDESLTENDPRLLACVAGVPVLSQPVPLRATAALVLNSTADYTELHIVLDEGKNRQIRKMCNALHLKLLGLHRKAIGQLQIVDLAVGQWRFLSGSEVEQLWLSSGGKERVERAKLDALHRMLQTSREASPQLERLATWLEVHDPAFTPMPSPHQTYTK
ncbi:MAG TPA: pseudouridine synthase [Polyangiaceae bacterium]